MTTTSHFCGVLGVFIILLFFLLLWFVCWIRLVVAIMGPMVSGDVLVGFYGGGCHCPSGAKQTTQGGDEVDVNRGGTVR